MLQGKGIIAGFQREVLLLFPKIPDSQRFCFAGGAALSEFYLGHRRSDDLDFFTSESDLIPAFSGFLQAELEKKGVLVRAVRRFQSFAEFKVSAGQEATAIHLAYDSPFRFSPPVDSAFGVKVRDYQDIIVDKMLAFFGRTEPRDAVDLFFIAQKEDLRKLAELASQKDPGFDLYWLAVALEKVGNYPDDIAAWPVDLLLPVKAADLKEKFLLLSREIMDEVKRKGRSGPPG